MKRAKILEKLAATNDAVNKDTKQKETKNEKTATEEAGVYFSQLKVSDMNTLVDSL